jgi:hypothetical protein
MTGVRRRVAALAAAAMVGLVSPTASADPWKDESGHGRGRGDRWEGDWRGGECRKYELFTGERRRAVEDTACRRRDGAWIAAAD